MSSGLSGGLSMQVTQRQEMTMTPQMIQSMELLQMPLLQLEQRLRQEQVENPVLELEDLEEPDDDGSGDRGAEAGSGEEDGDAEEDEQDVPEDGESEGLTRFDDVDYDWDDDYRPKDGRNSSDDEERFDPIANAQSRPPSLVEHLLRQLAETPIPDRVRRLAAGIVMKLDGDGYLSVPLRETVPEEDAPASAEETERALDAVQRLDPDGIGARTLSECLLLQAKNRPENTPVVESLIEGHLDDLGANHLPKIAKDLKCDMEEVKRAAAFIRTLSPKPGAEFSRPEPLTVRPELAADEDGRGGFTVRLLSGARPRISDLHIAMFDNSRRGKILRERFLSDPAKAEEFRQYQSQMRQAGLSKSFREKYNGAQWLVKAVAQREKTLLEVAAAIVEAQTEYLARERSVPAPLMMQEVADRVGYDISTISRAVKDKYIDTPIGVKPLKDFFARAAAGTNQAEGASSNADVLLKIREMIDAEDGTHPLRDNEIMDRLAEAGFRIKRRSVANYRERLGIPSHSQRREY